jgi:Tfp pilus assembly protein FimV
MAGTSETKEMRIKTLKNAQEKRKQQCKIQVNSALERMIVQSTKINFSAVAKEANVSVAYLYKDDELKARIIEIRNQQQSNYHQPQLRDASVANSQLKMIARFKDKIKRQDEEIKQLKQINEHLSGRIYRLTELEYLSQCQEKKIKDLEARLSEIEIA